MSNDTNQAQLPPCPCCGSRARIGPHLRLTGWVSVFCDTCGLELAKRTKEAAIEAWSRRTEAAAGDTHAETGLSLLRQIVCGQNALRQMDVFPCNETTHDDNETVRMLLGTVRSVG